MTVEKAKEIAEEIFEEIDNLEFQIQAIEKYIQEKDSGSNEEEDFK
jgi:hypothetical protein